MQHSTAPLKAFAYVNADKAPAYRAVMRVFVDAKSRFVLHLRPREIAAALAEGEIADHEIDVVLLQLCEWGNLEAHPDTTDVTTVEDFYRKRYLYQLTAAGEAAERALTLFFETIRQPGELKTAALSDIHALLEELLQLAGERPLDDGKVHRTLLALRQRFDELTSKAQAFIGSLLRPSDLHGKDVGEFLVYKEQLIDYLERFVAELVMATSNIAETIRKLEEQDVEALSRNCRPPRPHRRSRGGQGRPRRRRRCVARALARPLRLVHRRGPGLAGRDPAGPGTLGDSGVAGRRRRDP